LTGRENWKETKRFIYNCTEDEEGKSGCDAAKIQGGKRARNRNDEITSRLRTRKILNRSQKPRKQQQGCERDWGGKRGALQRNSPKSEKNLNKLPTKQSNKPSKGEEGDPK